LQGCVATELALHTAAHPRYAVSAIGTRSASGSIATGASPRQVQPYPLWRRRRKSIHRVRAL